jgi:platelet-activating factor acetylhydrolase
VWGDFASHGFVVCALEHRDGSGPSTFVNMLSEDAQTAPEKREGKKPRQVKYIRLDYVIPRGNADDTLPSNEV